MAVIFSFRNVLYSIEDFIHSGKEVFGLEMVAQSDSEEARKHFEGTSVTDENIFVFHFLEKFRQMRMLDHDVVCLAVESGDPAFSEEIKHRQLAVLDIGHIFFHILLVIKRCRRCDLSQNTDAFRVENF